MYSRILIFTLLLLFASKLGAQVTIEPVFPDINDEITVYFDATKGNQGLKDCNCEVYAHTGLITDKSIGPTDWKFVQGNWGTDDQKVLMTKVGDNLYSISYVIKTFYGVPEAEQIKSLAFVFRNVNGTKVGRATDGSDIYYPFSDQDSLQYIIESPEAKDRIITPGTDLNFKAYCNVPSAMRLSVNGHIAEEVMSAKSITFDSTLQLDGTYHFDFQIISEIGTKDTSFTWIVPSQPITEAVPEAARLGAHIATNGKLRFLLEAPRKDFAYLFIPGGSVIQMKKSLDGQFFWIELDTTGLGGSIQYQYWLSGDLQIPDPLSKVILDPWNDKYISGIIYPGMPLYPLGMASGLVSYLDWQSDYQWQSTDIALPAPGQLIIYEMLVRDYLANHSYQELADSIMYWKRLGVNAIELMPVNEFEGNISWGYNPALHNAIDKYYGSANQLKRFIDMCHQHDIAVISDVVFNHAFGSNPMVNMYWDSQKSKPALDNPWFNPDAKHPYNVGYDFNHESMSTKRYVNEVLRRLLEDFHFDGFRFDLSKGFTQKYSGTDLAAWSAYDAGRIAILNEYRDSIISRKANAYVILEHFADNAEEKELANKGFLIWGNMSHDYQESAMGFSADLGWGYFKNRNWNEPHLISYMESHDEERLMYKVINFGNSAGSYNIRDFKTAINRICLASTFFYTLPGAKMLWQMGELGYDYSINYCADGSINNNCRTDPKPIRWDYLTQSERLKLWGVTAALIKLKRENNAFENASVTSSLSGLLKQISMNEPELKMLVMGNFDVRAGNMVAAFPTREMYYNYLGNDSIMGNTSPLNYILQPGEYKLYLNKKVNNPFLTLDSHELFSNENISFYPTIINSGEVLKIEGLQANNEKLNYTFYNNQGIVIKDGAITCVSSNVSIRTPLVTPGIYYLKLVQKNLIKSFAIYIY